MAWECQCNEDDCLPCVARRQWKEEKGRMMASRFQEGQTLVVGRVTGLDARTPEPGLCEQTKHMNVGPNAFMPPPFIHTPPGGLGDGLKRFETGANRSGDQDKNFYVGYLSTQALEEFGDYMTRHRVQPNGELRDPDNWKLGIPLASYLESLFRHVIELVGLKTGYVSRRLRKEYPGKDVPFLVKETACAVLFNIQGFLHETLKTETLKEQLGTKAA